MEAKLDSLKDQMKANMDDKIVEDHIEHQKKFLQLSKDNLPFIQNRMKKQEDQHYIETSYKKITKSRTPQVRSISEYLSKWKNFPVKYFTWEDENFIQKHQEIIKH